MEVSMPVKKLGWVVRSLGRKGAGGSAAAGRNTGILRLRPARFAQDDGL